MFKLNLVILLLSILLFPQSGLAQESSSEQNGTYRYYISENGTIYISQNEPLYLQMGLGNDRETSVALNPESDNSRGNPQPIDLQEGTYRISISGIDNSTNKQRKIVVDATPPSSKIDLSGAPSYKAGDQLYYGKGLAADFTASDELAGISEIQVALNNNEFQAQEGAIKEFPNPGNIVIEYYATDRVGNKEDPQKIEFYLDYTPPDSRYTIEGSHYLNTLGPDAGIILDGKDQHSGLNQLHYSIDDSSNMEKYSSKLNFESLDDGSHTLYFRATDQVENRETLNRYKFNLDTEPPELTLKKRGASYDKNGSIYVAPSTEFVLEAEDKPAGIQELNYKLNDREESPYRDAFTLSSSKSLQYITYYAIDRVGNRSKSKYERVFLDQKAPKTDFSLSGAYLTEDDWYVITSDTRLELNASDLDSGVETTMFSINDGEERSYTEPLKFDSSGRYTVRFYSSDHVGNTEQVSTVKLRVDNEQLAGASVSEKPKKRKESNKKYYPEPDDAPIMVGAQSLQVYISISPSPSDTTDSYLLVKNKNSNFESGQKYATEGIKELILSMKGKSFRYLLQVDGSKPVTSINYQNAEKYQGDNELFFGENLTVSLSAEDNSSGIEKIYVSKGGENFRTYEEPISSFFQEKKYVLRYYSIDKVGNEEEIRKKTFTVDKSAPKTQHSISGAYSGSRWSPGTRIKLQAADNLSGISKTVFSLNQGEEKSYEGPVNLSELNIEDGKHTFEYYSIDHVGNREEIKKIDFVFDRQPPSAEVQMLNDAYKGKETYYISPRTRINFTTGSQPDEVDKIEYRFDGNQMHTFREPFTADLPAGAHQLVFRVADQVGNTTSNQTRRIVMDKRPPNTEYSISGPSFKTQGETDAAVVISAKSGIRLSAEDNSSGVKNIRYRMDGDSLQNYNSSINLRNKGRHNFAFYAVDRVNNREKVNQKEIILDLKPPEVKLEFTPKPVSGTDAKTITPTTLISLVAVDEYTDVDQLQYRINDGPMNIYRNPITDFEGSSFTLTVQATDLLGNTIEKTYEFEVTTES